MKISKLCILTSIGSCYIQVQCRLGLSLGIDKLCFFSHLLFYSPILRIYAYYAFEVVLLFSMLVSILFPLSTLQRSMYCNITDKYIRISREELMGEGVTLFSRRVWFAREASSAIIACLYVLSYTCRASSLVRHPELYRH